MNTRRLMLAAGFCLGMTSIASAGGDPFYFSTWYRQSNLGAGGAAVTVMPGHHPYQPTYSFPGPLYLSSPRYFQPGYGYAVPRSPFRSTLRYYDQYYSFGELNFGAPYGSSSGAPFGGSIGSSGSLTPVGTLHSPWYFPGSPGNDREFLYAW